MKTRWFTMNLVPSLTISVIEVRVMSPTLQRLLKGIG